MSKLLLTSAGFTNKKIVHTFEKLTHKPLSETSIALVAAGVRSPEMQERQDQKVAELLRLGFGEVHPMDCADPMPPDALDRFDALYMRGGNTFFILQTIRQTGFDHLIVSFILRGGTYVGSSAGSIIMGPDIELAGLGPHPDSNDIELQNTKALGIVPFAVYPHFQAEEERDTIEALRLAIPYPLLELTDEQAMLCVDGNYLRIG
jgi:dipeptidase E